MKNLKLEKTDINFIYNLNKNGHNKFSFLVQKGCSCEDCKNINPNTDEINEITQQIVTCVNSHDDLVEACKEAQYALEKEGYKEPDGVMYLLQQALNSKGI